MRGFRRALVEADEGLAVIAEVKRRSPSKGDLAPDLDPVGLAAAYRQGDATCLSVLTDVEFFGAHPGDLARARDASGLPVLRKDFTVSAHDVADARILGADAVLLIAAALDDAELADFRSLALELDLDALVEVHDEAEMARATALGATLVGVNNRDLRSFQVDLENTERLAALAPADALLVTESGIFTPADVERLEDAGAKAMLVGESLMRQADVEAATRALLGRAAG